MQMNIKSSLFAIATLLIPVAAMAKTVSEQTAHQFASTLMAGKSLVRHAVFNRPARTSASTDNAADAPYYVFTGADGRGFIVISADDAVRPVLAYSADAPTSSIPDNMQEWLDGVGIQIQQIRNSGEMPTAAIQRQWHQMRMGNPVVELQTAQWGQNYPYNTDCPYTRGMSSCTGCVATAYAIMMRYYEYPQYGRGTTAPYLSPKYGAYVDSRNVEHSFDWTNMPLTYGSNENYLQRYEVARLMADIGASIQLDYGYDETYGYLGRYGIMQNFDYSLGSLLRRSSFSYSEWDSLLQTELNEGRPVIYRGENYDGANGHAFILDGYDDFGYYRVNWGWNGEFNGFFSLEDLSPSLTFTNAQMAQIGCMPMPMATGHAVASAGGSGYETLLTAFAAADMEGTDVVMEDDAVLGDTYIPQTSDLTFDLNGHHLTAYDCFDVDGKLRVKDSAGDGEINLGTGNLELFAVKGNLVIDGGKFINSAPYNEYYDWRYSRVIWTARYSSVEINGGTFFAQDATTMCFNGDAVINGGSFSVGYNTEVLSNYNTDGEIQINGGTFTNEATPPTDGWDYRRAIWTTNDTRAVINGGKFSSLGGQTLCFNGKAQLNGAEIDTPNGLDCYASDSLTIVNCRFGGNRNLYAEGDASIQVFTGLFSNLVPLAYLAPDSKCATNKDSATNGKYRFVVTNSSMSDAIEAPEAATPSDVPAAVYSLSGIRLSSPVKGLNIIRTADGKSHKVMR